jgi:hypothetical protein
LFGSEPAHAWCYYYEKADYERQREDWNAVLSVGDEAFSKGLFPADPIEWMPFLQAYARTDNPEKLQELAPRIAGDPFIARQVCQQLKEITNLSSETENIIDGTYCASQ